MSSSHTFMFGRNDPAKKLIGKLISEGTAKVVRKDRGSAGGTEYGILFKDTSVHRGFLNDAGYDFPYELIEYDVDFDAAVPITNVRGF